jgi:hypothetical protein
MEMVMTEQSTENMEYVRRLLWQKQPGFAAALESAVDLVERELCTPEMPARPARYAERASAASDRWS